MPAPSLSVSFNRFILDLTRLQSYRASSLLLEPKYQHLISEVILLRLFSIMENYVKDVCCKIACEAPYRSGTVPIVTNTCSSVSNALYEFQHYNRTKSSNPKWTNSRFANDTIKKVIPPTAKVRLELNNHSVLFDEMRIVRNHVAHRTSSTYANYKVVVRTTYGGNLKITTGAFLVSTKRIPVCKIDYYLAACRIFASDLTS